MGKTCHLFFRQATLWGERWLRENPSRLFTDSDCNTRLPLAIPAPEKVVFHRIIVAHGAARACKSFFQGGSGSLMIDSHLDGEEAHSGALFQIGHVSQSKGFVHILDDTTLEIVLKTLDTIADFTAYLQKKEALLCGSTHISAAGEEELLGHYLKDLNEQGQHDFVIPRGYSSVAYGEGQWSSFCRHEQRRSQLQANSISYAWDELIEEFTLHTFSGTHRTTTQKTIGEQEILYRWLAREPRTRRRTLAQALLGLTFKTPPGFRATRIVEPSFGGDPHFLFLVLPRTPNISDDDYRDTRQKLLGWYCLVMKLRYPSAVDFVGIATEAGPSPEDRSEDLIYFDARDWTSELDREAREVQKELGLLTHVAEFRGIENEYPQPGRARTSLRGPVTISRNKRCPCNSGKRYGKCHGKAFYERKTEAQRALESGG